MLKKTRLWLLAATLLSAIAYYIDERIANNARQQNSEADRAAIASQVDKAVTQEPASPDPAVDASTLDIGSAASAESTEEISQELETPSDRPSDPDVLVRFANELYKSMIDEGFKQEEIDQVSKDLLEEFKRTNGTVDLELAFQKSADALKLKPKRIELLRKSVLAAMTKAG